MYELSFRLYVVLRMLLTLVKVVWMSLPQRTQRDDALSSYGPEWIGKGTSFTHYRNRSRKLKVGPFMETTLRLLRILRQFRSTIRACRRSSPLVTSVSKLSAWQQQPHVLVR